MSPFPPAPHDWTYAEYARLPDDGNRYEVLDGEVLVTPGPAPKHQHVLGTLYTLLRAYVEQQRLGIVFTDVDLLFETGQYLRPDLVYVPESALRGITDRGVELRPGLVVEVLSPTSSSIDRVRKPQRYGDFGVPEYWVLDPVERVAWIWRFPATGSQPLREAERMVWKPAGAAYPFRLDVQDLFRPMFGVGA
jgi:Uma2 family endonuclease